MAPQEASSLPEIYLLPLTDDGSPDVPGGYVSLPPPSDPPYAVRFSIEGTSSICRQGSLWVNAPRQGEAFDRARFQEFKLKPDFRRNLEIDIPIHAAGAFAFYTTYTPLPDFTSRSLQPQTPTRTETYYLDVSPRLGLQDEYLPLNSVSIFSIISKFMGKYPPDWDHLLESISQRSYNMLHFTPLMHRGKSNSPYSIYDQLSFDPECFPRGEKDVSDLVNRMEKDFGLLSLADVVWNHTANNSLWLEEHPEAGYSVDTAPWLEPALEVDTGLMEYSKALASHGLPTDPKNAEDLRKITDGIKSHVLDPMKFWEYYILNVERDAKNSIKAWADGDVTFPKAGFAGSGLGGLEGVKAWSLGQKAEFLKKEALNDDIELGKRFHRKVNPSIAAALLTALYGRHERGDAHAVSEGVVQLALTEILVEVNHSLYKESDADCASIQEQVYNRVRYVRLDENGPKLGPITEKDPLVESYFTRLPINERTKGRDPKCLALVNNGWVWNANAMIDNAGPRSRVYLRREVVVWGDCVKLRYGNGPADNPFLWDFMVRYTRLMAKYFAGFRIDNCHSTPLHVAEHFLDEARKVRPNLYICAELFTGSEETDYVFVKRLGISSLIREAMQAWGPGELSRLVHRHGGRPIGSFEIDEVAATDQEALDNGQNGQSTHAKQKQLVHRIKQTPVHALFMDCTHDNETPTQKREARDTLPNAALVAMCACAIGSVMGYDEIYPKIIDLVHETRQYTSFPLSGSLEERTGASGMRAIKKLLNDTHHIMGKDGYDETYVHHEGEYITVHRVHPLTRKGYFLIAHTSFPGSGSGNTELQPTHLDGTMVRHLGSWKLEVDASKEAKEKALNSPKLLTGLPSHTADLDSITLRSEGNGTIISIEGEFPPGSIALFETWIPTAEHREGLDTFVTSGARQAFKDVGLVDLNYILYRCEPEERDSSDNWDGVYDVPKFGTLAYAGLQGWWSVLRDIIRKNDLGHPLCEHLREGQWALDYTVKRMDSLSKSQNCGRLKEPAEWLKSRFDVIRKVPSFLLPRYFALTIQTAYTAAWDRGISLMTQDVRDGQEFLQRLAMVSVQQIGYMSTASLWPHRSVPCMAAGLPHFAADWARCWGRDIFISMRGLCLATGRYEEAKEHIKAFASVLKHGMIPNLLSAGKLPRYNSRDSVWFFLQSIQDYVLLTPDGQDILKERVSRRFLPYDDTFFDWEDPRAYSTTSSIEDVIQEILQRHAHGLSFREARAGPELDMQMKTEGFQIDVRVDWETGLIFGGNQHNCGTWMDKMGESETAHSKGIPGTPRDGAAIEIIGLLYSTLVWLSELHKQRKYKYDGVNYEGEEKQITFENWALKIKQNFERCFYIPVAPKDDSRYDINAGKVNRRGIYKDLYKSGKEYEDYQLRANFPIAMCVASELFDPQHALLALSIADKALRGPLGMATLDPADLNYHPNYVNSEDSDNFATAKGRNYHQGPEWIWPTGYFLRALLKFDLLRRKSAAERTESFQQITRRLEGCKRAIQDSPWASLPELTQKNGEFCPDSSPSQAWSAGCLIDLFLDVGGMSVQ